jgi:hypothetical protein
MIRIIWIYLNVTINVKKVLTKIIYIYIYFFSEYKYRLPSVTKWRLTTEYCNMFKEVKQRTRPEEPKNSSVIPHNCDIGESQTLTISLPDGGRGCGREEMSNFETDTNSSLLTWNSTGREEKHAENHCNIYFCFLRHFSASLQHVLGLRNTLCDLYKTNFGILTFGTNTRLEKFLFDFLFY